MRTGRYEIVTSEAGRSDDAHSVQFYTLPMTKSIGILTAGGDSPGLNAAIRGVGKAAINLHGWNVLGFQNGFRGLLDNRFIHLDSVALAGILTQGGTILGTSRDKPNKMLVGGKIMDMTDAMVETYHKNRLDALVCLRSEEHTSELQSRSDPV